MNEREEATITSKLVDNSRLTNRIVLCQRKGIIGDEATD